MNYKHLRYFWMVAKTGSIARASEQLHITPQTISGQLSVLEDSLGKPLFARVGRQLELTAAGQLVLSYAEDIFALGAELEQQVRNLPTERALPFRVGIADVVPKVLAYRLLEPALHLAGPVRLICREEKLDNLLAELAVHRLDLVLADSPIPSTMNVKAFNHKLGECGITFFASEANANDYPWELPKSLHGAPLLLPGDRTVIHTKLSRWLEHQQVYPRSVGEGDASARSKVFGQAGAGIFVAPSVIAPDIQQQYGACIMGTTEEVSEEFFALSLERRLTHPAVIAITETARHTLFTKSVSR